MNLTDIRALALTAAERATEVIVAARARSSFTVYSKTSASDLVTTADRDAEQAILNVIRQARPDDATLAEESSPQGDPERLRGPLWIIDPIDGTTNFVHGLPMVGISIAFAIDCQIQVGVVCCPFLGETFAAIRGGGATLNGRPLGQPPSPPLSDSLIAIGFPCGETRTTGGYRLAQEFERIYNGTRDGRRLGAASIDICYVAAGRFQGFSESLQPWDIAAGELIARETGCVVGHLTEPSKNSWPESYDPILYFLLRPILSKR